MLYCRLILCIYLFSDIKFAKHFKSTHYIFQHASQTWFYFTCQNEIGCIDHLCCEGYEMTVCTASYIKEGISGSVSSYTRNLLSTINDCYMEWRCST